MLLNGTVSEKHVLIPRHPFFQDANTVKPKDSRPFPPRFNQDRRVAWVAVPIHRFENSKNRRKP